jgi:hypothetical protein
MTEETKLATETVYEEPQHSEESLLNKIIERQAIAVDVEEKALNLAMKYSGPAVASNAGMAANHGEAVMKIMLGRELGLSPAVSLAGINVIKGRASCSGALIAALLKKAGFSWAFVSHDRNGCRLAVYRHGKPLMNGYQDEKTGEWIERQAMVEFSREMAERAGLALKDSKDKNNYDKYGEDMYFNRCISRLQRRYAPEATAGIPLYSTDELQEQSPSDTAEARTASLQDQLKARLQAAKKEVA